MSSNVIWKSIGDWELYTIHVDVMLRIISGAETTMQCSKDKIFAEYIC